MSAGTPAIAQSAVLAASEPMPKTRWYLEDSFGLRTADEAGKNAFEQFAGQHIRFTMAELDGWLDKYFAA